MPNFIEASTFDTNVPKFSNGDAVDETILNPPLQALVDRTKWLKDAVAFRGALVKDPPVVSNGVLHWITEQYDTDGIHSTVANTDRLTVPAGVTKVKLNAQVMSNGGAQLLLGASFDCPISPNVYGNPVMSFQTPVIDVAPGDYFTLAINGTSATGPGQYSWFAMEIVA